MKKEKNAVIPIKEERVDEAGFENSISEAFQQKNEKLWFFLLLGVVAVIVLLIVSALADLLVLCFEVNRWFGYAMSAIMLVLVCIFIIRPCVKVFASRFFTVNVTADGFDAAKRRNAKVLKGVAGALVAYNENPKNIRYRYITPENTEKLKSAATKGGEELKAALKEVYADDVGRCANALIWKNAGKTFLTTSISQNDKIDALSVLLVNLSLVKQIVGIYGYRPSYAKLFRIYFTVLRSALLAYGMQNVNWFNVFGKFFSGVAKKIPFMDTLIDSAVQGTVSAFLTVLVGYKTKKYLCADYKKQEKIAVVGEENTECADDEVRIAAALAKEICSKNKEKAKACNE
ncbi:MAG: DUF697 domain-containing protein [Clostridia bacterium]|nr:DUF697 domain-containing protein [Clostridia bacterium]